MKIDYRGLNIKQAPLGVKMTTDCLFGPNEQVIFDFYHHNKDRYKRVVDIGANIGVHSIIMARLGWSVRAYEPDPEHFTKMLDNLVAHDVQVETVEAAVSDHDGFARFVRVLDNTTASHLEGAKASYGPRDTAVVRVVDCRPLFAWADLVKIDCEGHEAAILLAADLVVWRRTDALVEVGSEASARSLYDHLQPLTHLWAQKIGWGRVECLEHMPVCHRDGSLFIGKEPAFLW